jgi:glutamine cyclotransferase
VPLSLPLDKESDMKNAHRSVSFLLAIVLATALIAGCSGGALQAGENTGEGSLNSPLSNSPPVTTVVPSPTSASAPTLTVAPSPLASPTPEPPPAATVAHYTYQVVETYPHDPEAFTQGLVYRDGQFIEGTGLRGRSSLRRVAIETGEVLQMIELAPEYFGEGVALLDGRIFQLTWQSHVGFVYEEGSFDRTGEFRYPTEGWGLTHDGQRLIMSDGTPTLHFLDPETLAEVGQVLVHDGARLIQRLNELEYINGQVYANVWQTDQIAIIEPATGTVTGWIDLTGLLELDNYDQPVDVLNGIAYDAAGDRLFVTGKLWPKLFQIELVNADATE